MRTVIHGLIVTAFVLGTIFTPAQALADGDDQPTESALAVEPPAYEAPVVQTPVRATPWTGTGGRCLQRRDRCGWPLDWCGKRYGRFEVILEGSLSYFNTPTGPFGGIDTGFPNQMRWDGLDYNSDLARNIGGRAAFRYALAPQSTLELRGAYYGSPEDSGRAAGVYGFFPGPGGGGVSDPNSALLTSEAELYGVELNWWKETCCTCRFRWDLGIGARYTQFDETSSARAWEPPFPGLVGPEFVESDASNRFLGGQVGIGGHLDVSPRFEVNMLVKGLVGSMRSEVTVRDRSFFGPGAHSATNEKSRFTAGADFELSGKFRMTRRLALTFGYNMLFFPEVVRGPDGMDFTQSDTGAVQATTDRTDTLLVHTVFVGFAFGF